MPERVLPSLIVALLAAAAPGAAQSIRDVDRAVAGQTTILQRFTPPPRVGTVDIAVEDQRRRVPDAEAEAVRFRLRSITIDGAETVPLDALVPIWRDFIGADVSVADLYRIADAIDEAYVRAGYFSMTVVPVQDFASGAIRLRVYESYLASVEITSAIPGIERRLKPYIDRIVAMRPIRIKEAERILSLISDLGGLEIEGTFYRPEVPTGGGSLVLDIGFSRSSGMLALDNLGNDAVGPLELSATVALNDVLGMFETTNLVVVTIPDSPQEMALLQLSQDYPVGHDGLTAGYTLSYISQEPGGDLASEDISIETRVGSAYLSYPLVRSLDRNLRGGIEINARNDAVDVGGVRADRAKARWLVGFLRFDQDFPTASVAGSVSVGQGLDDDLARETVPGDYRFLAGDLDWTRPIGERHALRVRAAGQYAATPVPGAVQFTIGGDPYGWAFDGSSLSGDSGAAAAVELSRAVDTGSASLGTISVAALGDFGVVWNHDVAADYARDTLGSVGVGVSGMLGGKMTFQVVAAAPWKTGETVEDPGSRIFFRIGLPL